MIAEELMSSSPFVAQVTDSVRRVVALLLEKDVRHLPVVDDGRVAGMISDRDLRRLMEPLFDLAPERPEHGDALEQPISSLMSSDVISVEPESDVADAIDLMIEHKIGAVLVIDPHSAKLLGIISYVDVLRAARDVL